MGNVRERAEVRLWGGYPKNRLFLLHVVKGSLHHARDGEFYSMGINLRANRQKEHVKWCHTSENMARSKRGSKLTFIDTFAFIYLWVVWTWYRAEVLFEKNRLACHLWITVHYLRLDTWIRQGGRIRLTLVLGDSFPNHFSHIYLIKNNVRRVVTVYLNTFEATVTRVFERRCMH